MNPLGLRSKALVWMVAVGVLLAPAAPVPAKDYSADWKFSFLVQPRYEFKHGSGAYFRFRRLRAIATGPLSSRLTAKLQFDRSGKVLRAIDSYVDWQAVKGTVPVNVRLGLGYPLGSKDGTTAPVQVTDYSLVTEAFRLSDRWAGVHVTVKPTKRLTVGASISNAQMRFLTGPNDRPTYQGAMAYAAGPLSLRLWGMTGFDRSRPSYAETKTEAIGLDLLDIKFGQAFAEAGGVTGRRFGKKMTGLYTDLGYRFSKNTMVTGRFEWCDTNRDLAGAIRQRWTLGAQQRLSSFCAARGDLRYEQGTGHPDAILQLDFNF